jgi:fibronectin type 3 domain-containing protein
MSKHYGKRRGGLSEAPLSGFLSRPLSRPLSRLIVSALVCAGTCFLVLSMGSASSRATAAVSTGADLVAMPGHIQRLARPQNDAGEAPASLHMSGLELVYAKTPAQEAALTQLLADQQNPKSANYHHWLTPTEYGARFGASDSVVQSLSSWLKSNGFQVGDVPAGRGHLPFSGTKAQVEAAFHTPIHLFHVNGEQHFANTSDPMIPATLKPAIAAIRGLNDFYPKPGVRPMTAAPRGPIPTLGAKAKATPNTYYSGSNQYPGYVGPSDFAEIYNLNPVYQQGITGAGVTVVIAAQSDIDTSLLTTFWTAFGVNANGAKFGLSAEQSVTVTRVPVSAGGSYPGLTRDGNEDEAYLDTEIVGGLAPGAKIILVPDASAQNAAMYAIDADLGAILNISFGECEYQEGTSNNSSLYTMMQQAAGEGITVTVSTADAGAAACTASGDLGTQGDVNSPGFGVNGIASTPYNLAVGGTDFNDLTLTAIQDAVYWSTTNQSGTLETALSHVPEMAWNDSCANPVLASAYNFSDPIVFCNTTNLDGGGANSNPYILISGGGGGLSSCTTTTNAGACSGGYVQPVWQSTNVLGIANFQTRAIPDVSMIATRWLVCSWENTSCNPNNAPTFSSSNPGTILVLDGTSAASPSVAAIIALVDQTFITTSLPDGRQGLVNPTLYQLAATEYASSVTLTACNASQGAISNAACVFFDVTAGSNAQPCSVANYASASSGSLPASTCGTESSDTTGIMEISGVQDYAAGQGYDLATGLGSINAAALITGFKSLAVPAPTGLTASVSGTTATLSWSADASATGGYNVYQATAPGPAIASSPIQQNLTATTTTVTGLTPGQGYVFAISAVTTAGIISPLSNQATVTLAPSAPAAPQATPAGTGAVTVTWQASTGATTYSVFDGASATTATTLAKSGITATSYTVTGLTAGQTYFFTVVATDAGGASAPSAPSAGTTVIPVVPTGLTATAGNASVTLAWTAATGAATYNVFEGTAAGGEGTQAVQTGITGTSTSVSGLTNGTKYYFTVAAVNAGGTAGPSNEASATPAAPSSHGGGSMDWLTLGALAMLAAYRGARGARDRRGASRASAI